MTRARWRKVLHDLWGNKVRTLLVVASIFIGVISLGVTLSLYFLMSQDLQYSYDALHAHHAQISAELFEPEFLHSVRRLPGVRDAEGRRIVNVRVKTEPDKWASLQLTAIPDFTGMRIDLRMRLTDDQAGT